MQFRLSQHGHNSMMYEGNLDPPQLFKTVNFIVKSMYPYTGTRSTNVGFQEIEMYGECKSLSPYMHIHKVYFYKAVWKDATT